MILEHIITDAEDGSELLAVLKKSLSLSSGAIRRLKRSDGLKLDGNTVFTNYRVSRGDRITVTLADPPTGIVPQKGEIEVLYEDTGLLAVNKPQGIIVHPSRARYTDTLSNYVLDYLLSTGGGGVRGGGGGRIPGGDGAQGVGYDGGGNIVGAGTGCHTVGRLDRDTSGAVLFAKNAHLKNLAIKALKGSGSRKEYLALVYGEPSNIEGVIDAPIRRLRERDMRRIVSSDGDRAVTQYWVEATGSFHGQKISLIRFRLMTGRTHQIRVHCHWSGFPIIGDCLYYTPDSKAFSEIAGAKGQLLHCELLAFIHPMNGERICIKAPVNPHMSELMEKLLYK